MNNRRHILDLFDKHHDFYTETVKNGIEKNRKGNAVFSITTKDGQPVSNAKITVTPMP